MAISRYAAVVFRNLADAATLVASSQLGTAPASRVQEEPVARRWRSTAAPAYLVFDLGSSTALDTFAAVGLTASTVRVRVSDDNTFATAAYDSTATASDQDRRHAIFARDGAASGRYVRFDFTHASLAYVEAGRVVFGVRSTFAYNFSPGSAETPVDRSEVDETRGGQDIVNPRAGYRRFDLAFDRVSAADRHGFVADMLRENGVRKGVLLLTDPGGGQLNRDSLYGRIADMPAISRGQSDTYQMNLAIKELL